MEPSQSFLDNINMIKNKFDFYTNATSNNSSPLVICTLSLKSNPPVWAYNLTCYVSEADEASAMRVRNVFQLSPTGISLLSL